MGMVLSQLQYRVTEPTELAIGLKDYTSSQHEMLAYIYRSLKLI